MGVTVREKTPGNWWVFVHHNGRRKSKPIGKDKRLAEQVAEKIRARLVLGDFRMDEPKVPDFKEYAERWLALPHDWKESTRQEYENDLRHHVFPRFKNHQLDQIQRVELRDFLDDLLMGGLASPSVNRIKVVMGSVLNHAVDAEILKTNPIYRLKVKGSTRKTDIDPLTFEEAELFLKEVEDHEGGLYYPPLLCALRTGMRIGEIEAHRWGDVDFNGSFMWVRRSHRGGRITGTKNRLRRQVDMSPHLAATLKAWKLTQKKRSLAQGIPVPEWTFSVRDGKMLHRNTLKWHKDKCLDKIGLRRISIHDLRHSYATIRLMKGHNLGDVSRQLGHQNVKVTDGVYCHWIPGSFKKEVHELDGPHLSAPYTHPGRTSVESL